MEPWRQQAARATSQAKVVGRGNRYTDGAYDLIVDEMFFKEGHKGLSFIGKFLVENSRDTEPGIQARPAGSRFDVVYNYKSNSEMSPVNTKALIFAVVGVTEEQVQAKQIAEDAAAAQEGRDARDVAGMIILEVTNTRPEDGPVQPFKGQRVHGETFRVETKAMQGKNLPRDQWFCGMDFRHVAGQTAETRVDGIAKLSASAQAAPPAPAPSTASAPPAPPVPGAYNPPPVAPPTEPPPPLATTGAPPATPPGAPATTAPPATPSPSSGSMLGDLGI